MVRATLPDADEHALSALGGVTNVECRGDTVLVPWAAGHCHLEGDGEAIACRPPDEERGR